MRIRCLASAAAASGRYARPRWAVVAAASARASSSAADPTRSVSRFDLPETLNEYGVTLITQEAYNDRMDMHKQLVSLRLYGPSGHPKLGNAFVAASATIAGNVEVWDHASVWYGCVIRGDRSLVRIGHHTNIQDSTVVTEALQPLGPDHDGSTIIGHYVTVGHSCIIRGATIENFCLIGMRSVVPEGCYIEEGSILGAGTVLAPFTQVGRRELWVGNPGRKLRDLTTEETEFLPKSAMHYVALAERHNDANPDDYPLYLQAEKEKII